MLRDYFIWVCPSENMVYLIYPANIVILLDGIIGLWVAIKDSRPVVLGDFHPKHIRVRVEKMYRGDFQRLLVPLPAQKHII